jgi:hypothetical protein
MALIVDFVNSFSHDILRISDRRENKAIIDKRVQSVALRILGLISLFLGTMTGFAALGSFVTLSYQFIPLSIYAGAFTIISHDTIVVGNNLSQEITCEQSRIRSPIDICKKMCRSFEKVKESYFHTPSYLKDTWILEPSFKLLNEISEDISR